MLAILIQSMLFASTGLLSVGSITLVILLLMSKHGWYNGLSYAGGYYLSYSIIGVTTVVLQYRAAERNADKSSILVPILEVLFGLLLLYLGTKNWRKPKIENKGENRFFSIANTITPLKAFGFGILVTILNFKNFGLFLSAVSIAMLSNLSITEKIIIVLLDALVFSLSVIVPCLIYMLFPNRRTAVLNRIKQFINIHSREISIWLPLIFGLIFISKGVAELI